MRRRAFFELHPNCCFCGGEAKATTEDHQPARIIFDSRHWPEGYNFPACDACNRVSRSHEQIFALISRFSPNGYSSEKQRAETQELIRAVGNNFAPDSIKLLTANEKRAFFRQENLERPANTPLSDIPMVGLDADLTESVMRMVLGKLFCALHYRHTGSIVPSQGKILYRWITNAYRHQAEHFEEFAALMRQRATLVRSARPLSDQFDYSFGIGSNQPFSAFFCTFRDAVAAYGTVFADGLSDAEINGNDFATPFNWHSEAEF